MPLYEVWQTGTPGRILFNGLHSTVGDLMIAASTLLIAYLAFGRGKWPARRWAAVASFAVATGVGYTAFSEWYNVYVLGSWAYASAMPVVLGSGIGLTPMAQWVVVPAVAFWATRCTLERGKNRPGRH